MYPRENNETFISFLFTSFHLAAPHRCPISFRDPDQPAPYTGWRVNEPSLLEQQYIIGRIQFSRVLRGEVGIVGAFIRIFKALIEDFIGLKRRKLEESKADGFVERVCVVRTWFPFNILEIGFSLWSKRVDREREEKRSYRYSLFLETPLAQFPNLEQTMGLLTSLWRDILRNFLSNFAEISFSTPNLIVEK